MAAFINEEADKETQLDTYCLQRIDWIEHQIQSDCIDEISKEEISNTLESLINYFVICADSESDGQGCFAAPGGLLQSLFEICKESFSASKEELEKMDNLLLNRMIGVFNRIYAEKAIPFDNILKKILSWFKFRQAFCRDIRIGFSPSEYYIPVNFYSAFREEMLALRNTDFDTTVDFAEYSIWVYNNSKNVPRPYMVGDISKFNKFAIRCCRNALVSAQCNGYFERIDSIKKVIRNLQSDFVSTPTVFISYNRGKEALVDEIQNCVGHFAIIKRDVNDLGFGDNITEFMNTIRQEDFALIVISDAYLKSDACMYELTTLFKDQGADSFNRRVLFLVCDDARSIYTVNGRAAYTEFWNNKYKDLVELKSQLTPEASVELTQSIRTVSYICLQIGAFLEYVKAVNNFGEENALQTISSFVSKMAVDGKIGRNPVEDFFIAMRSCATDIEEGVTGKMNRPYIVCHMMTSVDGRIDCNMTSKLPGVDVYYAALNSFGFTATLCGRVTAELEMAEPGAFEPKHFELLGESGFSKKADADKYSVVVDTKGSLLWHDGTYDGTSLIIVTSESVSKEYIDYLDAKSISWIACGKERIDLVRVVQILADEFGIERMGIVGGGTINTAFLSAGLLDEISIIMAPGIDARKGMVTVFDGLPADSEPIPLTLENVTKYDSGTVWLLYHTATV